MARAALSKELVEESASEEEAHDSSSTSDGQSDEGVSTQAAKSRKTETGTLNDDSSSSRGSDSDSDSDSDGGGSRSATTISNAQVNGVKRKQSFQNNEARKKKSKSTPAHVPSNPYYPPSGYLPIKSSAIDQASASVLSSPSLKSKQVWYITAPASIPVSKIKSLDIQAALRGDSILEYKGAQYNMHSAPNTNESLLLPGHDQVPTGTGNETTVAYQASPVPISRTLSLREMTKAPKSSSGVSSQGPKQAPQSNAEGQGPVSDFMFFARETQSRPPPRRQPQGLKKRYHPYGTMTESNVNDETLHETMPHPDQTGSVNGDGTGSCVSINGKNRYAVRLSKQNFEVPHAEIPSSEEEGAMDTSRQDGMELDSPNQSATAPPSSGKKNRDKDKRTKKDKNDQKKDKGQDEKRKKKEKTGKKKDKATV